MDFYRRGISGVIGEMLSAIICSAIALFCLQPDRLRLSKMTVRIKVGNIPYIRSHRIAWHSYFRR